MDIQYPVLSRNLCSISQVLLQALNAISLLRHLSIFTRSLTCMLGVKTLVLEVRIKCNFNVCCAFCRQILAECRVVSHDSVNDLTPAHIRVHVYSKAETVDDVRVRTKG